MAVDDWRALMGDPGTTGEALLALAADPEADPEALAALAADGSRLRQTPALAAAIFKNPRAALSVANRAVLTCHREGVAPEGIPAFQEVAAAILADPAALDPAVNDAAFSELLRRVPDDPDADQDPSGALDEASDVLAVAASALSDGSSAVAVEVDADAAAPVGAVGKPKLRGRRSVPIDFSRLKLYEKIRLATLGNASCRQNLLRDSNRMVALAAIRSPQITDGEVAKAAANRSLSEDVIRYIANRKELVKQYAVKLALVGNVKCPLTVALRLLPSLHAEDIKRISRSKNVPGALSVAARRLAAAREPQ